LPTQLKKLGLKSLPINLLGRARNIKLGFMVTDLMMLAASQQIYAWGKNWMTEKLSGKKGFVGILNQTGDEYRNKQRAHYLKSEQIRFWSSMAIGFGGNLLLPALLLIGLKSKIKPASSHLMGQAKKFIPMFNYNNGLFQSKFVLMWSTIMNDTVATALAARDKNELRETLSRYAVINLFYFLGDDWISKWLAQRYEKQYQPMLKGIKLTEKGASGMVWAKGLDEVLKPAVTSQQLLANTLGRRIFWAGLMGTSLCLGVGLTLANNWNTKRYVKKDETEQKKKLAAPFSSIQYSSPNDNRPIPINYF
jgi:hypothetical protein